MFNLLYTTFKAIRKVKNTMHAFNVKYKLYSHSILSGNRFRFLPPYSFGRHFSINSDLSKSYILVHPNVRVRNDFNITIGRNGKLTIGEHCFFNNSCSINCLGNIKIGNNNQFGEAVLMYDHNHNWQDESQLISDQGYTIGSIEIGDNCWIGSHVVILKDVKIGNNVIIGAGCVIFKSIPSNSIVLSHQKLLIKNRNDTVGEI